ncbi:hypothetical protein KCV00_g10257, partial [Aureobasidium melanogenum]
MIFLLPSTILSTQLHLPLLCFWDFAFSCSFFCIRLIPLVVDLLCVVVILVRGISRLFPTAAAVEFGYHEANDFDSARFVVRFSVAINGIGLNCEHEKGTCGKMLPGSSHVCDSDAEDLQSDTGPPPKAWQTPCSHRPNDVRHAGVLAPSIAS